MNMIQTSSSKTVPGNKKRGFSLLLVVLVGSFMLIITLAMADYARRLVSSLQVRGEAVQDLYTAEKAFECVKYWLRRDYRHFSDGLGQPVDPDTLVPEDSTCNGYTFDFQTGTDNAADGFNPSYAVDTGTFRIPFERNGLPQRGAGVIVDVVRDNPASELFDGTVRVYSQSNEATGAKTAERYQQYDYMVLYGADIMFVVDRSGSIDADDGTGTQARGLRSVGLNDWNKLLDAVNYSMRLLSLRIPAPHMGLLSFGTDAYDTGDVSMDNCANAECNWRQPDVPLTNNINNLINDMGTPLNNNDDWPEMALGYAGTNLSLGISIAGAELMGKYYPHTGLPGAGVSGAGDMFDSGDFEEVVRLGSGDFSDLPSQVVNRDRPDISYPDVMVIVTDGAPNGLMSTQDMDIDTSSVFNVQDPANASLNSYIFPMLLMSYEEGGAKLFRTPYEPTGAFGAMVLDTNPVPLIPQGALGTETRYVRCRDEGGTPAGYFPAGQLNSNESPHFAMCNTSMIATELKKDGVGDPNITIIGIYVTGGVALGAYNPFTWPEEAVWMHDHFVSETDDGDKLFAAIESYEELHEALLYLFEQLELVQAR